MRFRSSFVLVLGAALFAQSPPQRQKTYQGKEEELPRAVAPQPLPFSHRSHTAAGLACSYCHEHAKRADRAGLPSTARCMSCHATVEAGKPSITRLASLHRSGKPIPWVPVYRVPDFVFFSHASHTTGGGSLDCDSCHGPVSTRDVLAKEFGTNMTSCVNCHRAKAVSTECSLCHQLGQ